MEEELEAFNERLINWRRVYGDTSSHYRSPTLIFCQYAKATMERKHETESERYWRELSEVSNRDEITSPPDYADADLLNDVWARMPDDYYGLPIKEVIRVYVFGTYADFRQLMNKYRVFHNDRPIWTKKCLLAFKSRVEREQELIRQFDF